MKFLVANDRSRGVVADDRNIKLRQLVFEERLDRGNKINYQQAYRLRQKLQDDIFGNEVLSFSKIPALIKKMQSSAYTDLEVDERSRFQRTWVLPKAFENAMVYLRKFVAIDGAHCTSRHRLVLLAVTFLDEEREIFVLAWALVPVEDRANWLWFLQKIAPYLTALQDSDFVIISDRLKGIASAVAECFPYSTHSYCSKHLCDNIRTSFGEIVAQKFWGCAYAKTKSAFDKVLEEIKEMNKDAAEYISNLLRDRWVPYAINSSYYGQITSNIQESQNAAWLPARDMPAVYSMLSIWNFLGEKYFQRQQKRQSTERLTNSTWKHIQSEEAKSSQYKLINFTQVIAHVSTPSGAAHVVNF